MCILQGKMLPHTFFVIFIPLTCCLSLLEVHVPDIVDVREEAVLSCLYDLGGDELYSLKWYKEELEFYRYMPDNSPQIQTFPVDGINVVEAESNVTVITLSPLDYRSTGVYRCEVSSERPHFKTVYKSANLTVVAFPKDEPRIDGIKEDYLLGEYVEGNCTSSPSFPLAAVQWLINDRKAKDWFVESYKPIQSRDLNLEQQTLGLRFQIDEGHYQERNHILMLTCQETVAGRTKSRNATIHLSRLMTNQKFAQEQLNGIGFAFSRPMQAQRSPSWRNRIFDPGSKSPLMHNRRMQNVLLNMSRTFIPRRPERTDVFQLLPVGRHSQKNLLLTPFRKGGAFGLKLTRLSVPKLIDFRDIAVLGCRFDLEKQNLYSVKWYKGDLEFYRYMPNNNPEMQVFHVDGVHLDVGKSNMTSVTLQPLEFASSGVYACEVSTEAPHFKTVQATSFMNVIGMPRSDPVITGLKPMYSVGEFVQGNCTSDESYPIAVMQWYINDNQVEPWQLESYTIVPSDERELRSATLGVSFQADYNHFSGKGNTMNFKCVADVENIVRQAIYTTKLAELDLDKYAQGLLTNSASLGLGSVFLVTSVIVFGRIWWKNFQS